MTAISKAWVTIADGAVDAESPADQALMTGIRDDLIHLREWLGASFTTGAVQNHSHDGVDSVLIEIGSNYVRNGSFEVGALTSWTVTQYTGGSIVITSTASNVIDGSYATSITSSSTANGGGDILTSAFIPVADGRIFSASCYVKGSIANVSSKLEIVWYDSAQAQISVSTVYSLANTETVYTAKRGRVTAPSTSRFAKVKFTGGVPGVGTSAGTIFVDGILMVAVPTGSLLRLTKFTASGTWTRPTEVGSVLVEVQASGAGGNGASNGGGAGGYSKKHVLLASLGATETVTVGIGGATSANGNSSSFGAHATATGGNTSGSAGVGSSGDINLRGNVGTVASGGSSACLGGGTATTGEANSGAGGGPSSSGADGIVLVWEYA